MNNSSTASKPHTSLTSLVGTLPNSTHQYSTFSSSPSNALSPQNGHQHSQFTSGLRLFPDKSSPASFSRVHETVRTTFQCTSHHAPLPHLSSHLDIESHLSEDSVMTSAGPRYAVGTTLYSICTSCLSLPRHSNLTYTFSPSPTVIQAPHPYAIDGMDLDFEEWVQRASGYLKTIQVSAGL